jgi:hypothetical protein
VWRRFLWAPPPATRKNRKRLRSFDAATLYDASYLTWLINGRGGNAILLFFIHLLWKCVCLIMVRVTFACWFGHFYFTFDFKVQIDNCIVFSVIPYIVCIALLRPMILVPWAIQVYQALDCTIHIVSEILFRLAQHDTLWCLMNMITVEKRRENCRKLYCDILYLCFTINGKMYL